MRRIKLTRSERSIEATLEQYIPGSRSEFRELVKAVAARRKDYVLNIRVNRQDLEHIKQKAGRLGIKYQTFISEILHKVAEV